MKQLINIGFLLVGCVTSSHAQSYITLESLEQAVSIAWENNAGLQASVLEEERQLQLQKSASSLDKTQIYHAFDENNIAPNDRALRVYGVRQTFPFPTVWDSRKRLYRLNTRVAHTEYRMGEWDLKRRVSQAYSEVTYHQNRLHQLFFLDSLYAEFQQAATKQYTLGESGYLEKITATNYYQRIHLKHLQAEEALSMSYAKLGSALQVEDSIQVAYVPLTQMTVPDTSTAALASTYVNLVQQQAEANLRLQRQSLLPDISMEYFRGFNRGENARVYNGYSLGLSVPLWFVPFTHQIQAEKIRVARVEQEGRHYLQQREAHRNQLQASLNQYQQAIQYLEESGLPSAQEMQEVARKSYQLGEINYLNYIQILESATNSQLEYLNNLNDYNQTFWELYYLTSLP